MKFKKIILSAIAVLTTVIASHHVSAGTLTEGEVLTNYNAYMVSNPLHTTFNMEARRLYVDGKLAYCIEPAVFAQIGGGYNPSTNYSQRMNLITSISSDLGASSNALVWVAAQKMLHKEVGWDWSSVTPLSMSAIDNQINEINQKINQWNKKPSFDGQTVTVKFGESVTLTDTNNVLSEYSNLTLNSANLKYSVQGNKLTVTPKDTNKSSGTLQLYKPDKYGTPLVWDKPGSQTVITLGDPNDIGFSINLKIELKGNVTIQKLDKTTGKPVANTKFHVTFSDGTSAKDVTTDANGKATIEGITSGTEVTAVETSVPEPYVLDKTPFKGKIVASQTITLTQNNYIQPKFPRTGSRLMLLPFVGLSILGFAGVVATIKRRKEVL